jgi:hypothetical protein
MSPRRTAATTQRALVRAPRTACSSTVVDALGARSRTGDRADNAVVIAALVPFVSTCHDNRGMKLRRLRDGDDLDNDTVLVRGGELDRDLLLADARRYHLLYGTYGISLFAVRGLTIDEMAQQVPLVRFDRLTLITAWELASAGLRLEPTGRNPHHYTVGFDELERGVKAIVSCGRRVITNAYHDA